MPTRLIFLCLALNFATGIAGAQPPSQANLPRLQQHLDALAGAIDGRLAYGTVVYLQQHWRHGGNDGFNASMDHIAGQLQQHRYQAGGTRFRLTVHDTLLAGDVAWQPGAAVLRIASPVDTILHTLEREKMSLCINSHATPPEGFQGELVFIDTLRIEPGSLTGKLAYTHREARFFFDSAVVRGGAAGILSAWLPAYNQPEQQRSSVSMSSIPYQPELTSFGFNISYASRALLDSLLAAGPVQMQAFVHTGFSAKIVREVTAEIVGTIAPQEYIVIAAHVDEPGANDNASGSAALLEIAVRLQQLIDSGRLPAPARTIKMMWVEEIDTIRRWQAAAPDAFRRVSAAFVLDMVGQDTRKTGGTFLIEKTPDPSAIWTRPPDAHSEWGASKVSAESLRGWFLNDLLLHACQLRAAATGWIVKTNPFEGGSDHVPFLRNGIPAILAWHFTDVFYHTSNDDLDKVSAAEMANVAAAISATAALLASCSQDDATALLALIEERAAWRLQNELANSRQTLRSDTEATRQQEQIILKAWGKWYHEALASVTALPISGADTKLAGAVSAAQRRLQQQVDRGLQQIERWGE